MRKSVGNVPIYFVYDDNGQLLGEYDQSGNMIREYIWLGDRLVGMSSKDRPNVLLSVHTDHLGTVRAVSEGNATARKVLWRFEGDAFGDVLPNEDVDNNAIKFTMPIRMLGQYYDAEVGTSYNYFRDYDPSMGRYVESDPIGLRGGLNSYGYVGGSPIRHIDPLGLKVKFTGSPATQAALNKAYNSLNSTEAGANLIFQMNYSPIDYTITNQQNGTAYWNPNTNTISVDPNFHPPADVDTGSSCEVQPTPTNVILGHEIGHAITGTKDDGPNNMNNVNQNENPIRQQLGLPLRTRY